MESIQKLKMELVRARDDLRKANLSGDPNSLELSKRAHRAWVRHELAMQATLGL